MKISVFIPCVVAFLVSGTHRALFLEIDPQLHTRGVLIVLRDSILVNVRAVGVQIYLSPLPTALDF